MSLSLTELALVLALELALALASGLDVPPFRQGRQRTFACNTLLTGGDGGDLMGNVTLPDGSKVILKLVKNGPLTSAFTVVVVPNPVQVLPKPLLMSLPKLKQILAILPRFW